MNINNKYAKLLCVKILTQALGYTRHDAVTMKYYLKATATSTIKFLEKAKEDIICALLPITNRSG